MTERTLAYLPLKSIADTGENPRQKMSSAELNELAASIGEHGILQPILVERDGKAFKIIAGHRRVAAAAIAGLKEVPAQIEENGQNRRAAALTENIIRADLTALEEADALAQLQQETGDGVRELARRIGKGKDWVSDRLRLARLPDEIRDRVAAGDIGLHSVPALASLAEKCPTAARALVEYAFDGKVYHGPEQLQSADLLGRLAQQAYNSGKAIGMVLVDDWYGCKVDQLPLADEVKKDLAKTVKEIGPKVDNYGGKQARKFKFAAALATKAKKTGGLIELGNYKFITDADVIYPAAVKQCNAWAKEPKPAESAASGPATSAGHAGVTVTKEEAKAAAEAAQAEADQRAKEQAERAAVIHKANLELGKKLREKFETVEVTADNVRLLVEWILDLDSEWSDPPVEQLELVDERLQKIEDGEIVYANDWEPVIAVIKDDLAAATTAEELLGVFFRVMIGTQTAKPPKGAGYSSFVPKTPKERLDAIAKKARVVPKALKEESK